jgi:hypothetical protein
MGELCLLVGLAVVGLISELVAGDGRWLADLLVGLAVGFTGVLVVGHRMRDPVGWLLVAASLLWFVGTVARGELQLAHRGSLLIVLFAPLWVVSLPRRMSRWTLLASAVVAAAACSVSVGPWATSQTALVVVAAASCALALVGMLGGVDVPRREAWVAALPATAAWVAAATVSLRTDAIDPDTRLLLYQLGVVGAALAMGASRLARRRVVDRIVDVGRVGGLASALGDPTMRIGFEDRHGTFRGVDGSTVEPSASPAVTELDLGREGRARIVHRQGLLDDVRIRRDVEAAARLLAAHHRLTSEVRHRAGEVRASQTRLLLAADRASAAFAAELDQRVVPHLDQVLGVLPPDRRRAGEPWGLAAAVRRELQQLAGGATPPQLGEGLAAALRAMADVSPIAVDLVLDEADLDEPQARALYFTAAEAVSNAVRHSGASTVAIRLAEDDESVELRIDDDGNGSVTLRPGGGLVGLADRLAAMGGALHVTRSPTGGSSVRARLPRRPRAVQSIGSQTGTVHRSV